MMVLVDNPAPRPKTVDLDLICPEMGESNLMVLMASEPGFVPELQGTLSIKYAVGGEERYFIDGQPMAVGDGRYLIVNEGQRYTSEAMGDTSVDSLCIFFRPGFAEEVLRSLITPDDLLLDDPEESASSPIFLEKTYREDAVLSPALSTIYRSLKRREYTKGWLEEQFHDLLPRMLQVHRNILADIAKVPAIRRSTRIEIYRRLDRGREFMESCYAQPINLAEIARAASMAPHHFLRLFKSAFGITPHRYLTHLRLESARRLLATTDMPIAQISATLGFQSSTSFSLLFRRHVGMSPKEFREGREVK